MMQAMVLLCDVKIAKDIRPVWDYRQSPGEGAYSHHNGGGMMIKYQKLGIYPHHLSANKTQG